MYLHIRYISPLSDICFKYILLVYHYSFFFFFILVCFCLFVLLLPLLYFWKIISCLIVESAFVVERYTLKLSAFKHQPFYYSSYVINLWLGVSAISWEASWVLMHLVRTCMFGNRCWLPELTVSWDNCDEYAMCLSLCSRAL